ncbi:protein translocase subunit SecD [Coxiella endosymbiont of Amblyomma sculptum]|uniref:protein translocase subunit SecD n=1 Tax=Coxiella endosymbiont of Amblyomma sculptum TaxID=2487929 RepID=UPI00132F1FC4|nr:protein translocase subunit SecD [Coxiella endosymbiont of Amblyomma sculptum]QHG92586.1 protein translocase subunit SecD [Coxiella endosymbiont of Amblyomma sculptum]
MVRCHRLLWRCVFLVLLILGSILYALPNVYGEDPAIQISKKEGTPPLVFNVVERQIALILLTQRIACKSFQRSANTILVRFPDTETQLRAQDVIQKSIGADYSVSLNLAPRTPKWLQEIGAKPMRLGLDLRGGIHFLLNISVDAMVKAQENRDVRDMIAVLCKTIRCNSAKSSNPQNIIICFHNLKEQKHGINLLRRKFEKYRFVKIHRLGIEGLPSKELVYQIRKNTVDQIISILRIRINNLGISEPEIQQQGENRISVDLPGVQDTALAKDIIGKVASICLRLVDTKNDAKKIARIGIVPIDSKLYVYKREPVLLKREIILKGTSISSAVSTFGEDGRPIVQVRVHGNEAASFNQITGKNIGKPIAVVYTETQTICHHLKNGKTIVQHHQTEKIINIATIQTALGNNFQITNLSDSEYAKNLALLLRSGAYPVPIDFIQEKVIGPSLGQENIHVGTISVEINALLTTFFMAFYYRVFGIIADIALGLNIVLIVATLSILGATLTLPGVAGIALTIGISLDANVLINERIREELRNGISPVRSIKIGYDRAFASIVDANVATLIVMVVLFSLASGSVQGFAVTTTIGILSSMLTAIFFTRTVVNLIYKKRSVSQLSIGSSTTK